MLISIKINCSGRHRVLFIVYGFITRTLIFTHTRRMWISEKVLFFTTAESTVDCHSLLRGTASIDHNWRSAPNPRGDAESACFGGGGKKKKN